MTHEERMILDLSNKYEAHEKKIEALTKKIESYVSERKNKRAKGKSEDKPAIMGGE